jgi:hypothetical protein
MKGECCEFGPVLHVPLEADGFHKSFEVDQKQEILDFFREFGLVIVRDVVGEELRQEVEDELLKTSGLSSWNLSDSSNVNWKAVYGSQYNEGKGFVGYQPALGEATTKMRQVRMCFLKTKQK